MSDPNFKTLKDMEGEIIVALVPMIDPIVLQKLRLHKVEESGIWIESQTMIEFFFKKFGMKSAPKTMIFFSRGIR